MDVQLSSMSVSQLILISGAALLFGSTDPAAAQASPAASPAASIDKPSTGSSIEKNSLIVTSRYYIGPEDVLEIIVWRNPDLTKTVTVRPDGRISLPLIGDIRASGSTPSELTDTITSRLKDFMETPSVSVVLKEVNSYSIYITGQVNQPGRYFLHSKTTLLQAITIAGGFSPVADRTRIMIFRWTGGGTETKLKASYPDIVLKDHSEQNVVLKPGDTIVVPSETMVVTD